MQFHLSWELWKEEKSTRGKDGARRGKVGGEEQEGDEQDGGQVGGTEEEETWGGGLWGGRNGREGGEHEN